MPPETHDDATRDSAALDERLLEAANDLERNAASLEHLYGTHWGVVVSRYRRDAALIRSMVKRHEHRVNYDGVDSPDIHYCAHGTSVFHPSWPCQDLLDLAECFLGSPDA